MIFQVCVGNVLTFVYRNFCDYETGIWEKEDMDKITEVCRLECQRKKIQPTKLNIYAQFINRVQKNLHLVVCMSPVGEVFRTRLRYFKNDSNPLCHV